jgi:hypothetical protein
VRATSHTVQAGAAGVGVVIVDSWPVLLIWWAGASGSVGDLSEVRLLGVGLSLSVALGVLAAWLVHGALGRAARSSRLVPADVWGAYALALGVYTLALTVASGLMYMLLLTDENESLRSRFWLIVALWVAGRVAAVLLSIGSAAALLGWGRHSPPALDETGNSVPSRASPRPPP